MTTSLTITQPLRPGHDDLRAGFPTVALVVLGEDAPSDGEVEVLLEAFGQEDPTAAPRVAFWSERVTLSGAPLTLRFGTPDDAAALRFRVKITRDGATDTIGDALWPASGTASVVTETGEALGTAFPAPSIFRSLQQLDPEPASGGDVDGVVAHVAAQLGRDLDALLDREDYPAAFPDEVDESGARPARLAAWQKAAIVHLSGGFYTMSPRRHLQWLDAGLGYSPVAVCNNLTDIILWLRGVLRPGDLAMGSTNPDSTHPQNAYEWLKDRCTSRAEARRGAVFDDWRANARSRRTSTVRPGSIFLWEGHIDTVLRVRRSGRSVKLQLFDTGGVNPGPGSPPAPGVGTISNVLQEENWVTTVPGLAQPLCHAYLPTRDERALPPWPLHRPLDTDWRRFTFVSDQPAARRDDERHGTTMRLPRGADVAARLRDDARAPAAILMVLERATERVVYTSRPLALHRPLSALFGSVVQPPDPARLEARWFVRLAGGWERGADATQEHGRQSHVVLELYDDEEGLARLWRMDMNEADAAQPDRFRSRLALLTPERRRPASRSPDEQRLDARLAGALERAGGPPIADEPDPS